MNSESGTTLKIGGKPVPMIFSSYPQGSVLRAVEDGKPRAYPKQIEVAGSGWAKPDRHVVALSWNGRTHYLTPLADFEKRAKR